MSTRRWQIPVIVAAAAAGAQTTDPTHAIRMRDIAARMPVGSDTLLALVASESPEAVREWATRVYRQTASAELETAIDALTAAGLDPATATAFGILDPSFDGERITAVVQEVEGGVERWSSEGWAPTVDPEGMPYVELAGDLLADALTTIAAGGSLILSPSQPRAYLSAKSSVTIVAAADVATPAQAAASPVYAITDPLDTTAVLTLFQASASPSGPRIVVRKAGAWAPDDGTLLAQLKSINPPPVISVPPEQIAATVRQVDDYDAAHPQTAAGHPNGGYLQKASALAAAANGDGHSGDVMIALPVQPDDADRLAVDGGEDPDQLHVTLAFLGDIADCPDEDTLRRLVADWAATVPSPIEGTVAGPGLFTAGDKPVGVALPDLPALPPARQNLIDKLNEAGATPSQEHGYTPHVTLQYGSDTMPEVSNHPLSFPTVGLYYGDSVTEFPFGVEPPDLGDPSLAPVVASSTHHHARRLREAADTDTKFDADRAAADLAERKKRQDFEGQIGGRYHVLVGEGTEPSDASTAVAKEVAGEDARRELWEKDRADSLLAEKERRLRAQPALRLSAELTKRVAAYAPKPVVAMAVPHTRMPAGFLQYWTAGIGGAKIRWGTSGDWARAVRHLSKYMNVEEAKGAANELHKIATGRWTGSRANRVIEGGKKP